MIFRQSKFLFYKVVHYCCIMLAGNSSMDGQVLNISCFSSKKHYCIKACFYVHFSFYIPKNGIMNAFFFAVYSCVCLYLEISLGYLYLYYV